MTDIVNLLAQKAALEQQIAAAKPQAVAAVLDTMKALGVTWADLGVVPLTAVPKLPAKRKVKYRDNQGNTWTGVGQRPRWLADALRLGAILETYRVKD